MNGVYGHTDLAHLTRSQIVVRVEPQLRREVEGDGEACLSTVQ